MMQEKQHLNEKGLSRILSLKLSMNSFREKETHKNYFSGLPVTRYVSK